MIDEKETDRDKKRAREAGRDGKWRIGDKMMHKSYKPAKNLRTYKRTEHSVVYPPVWKEECDGLFAEGDPLKVFLIAETNNRDPLDRTYLSE